MKDEIVDMLVRRGGYAVGPRPLQVADLDFEFEAVLFGPASHPGLVLLIKGPFGSGTAVARRLRAFTTVLARATTRRPVTVLLLAPDISDAALSTLREICRVLVVPPDANLDASLRSLLPLRLPQGELGPRSADALLTEFVSDRQNDPSLRTLLDAARKGPEHVQGAVRDRVAGLASRALRRSAGGADD